MQIGMDEECTNMPLWEYEIEENDIEKQSEIVELEKKMNKVNTFYCWRYFTKMEKKGQCAIVAIKIYVTSERKYGTSHFVDLNCKLASYSIFVICLSFIQVLSCLRKLMNFG